MARVVVTGANRGIGLEIVKQLSDRGDSVAAICRRSSPELDATGVDVFDGVDVGDDNSVAELSNRLSQESVDMVINNAGILTSEGIADLNWDRMRQQFEINTLGPLRVSVALLPRMADNGKIGILTSRVGSMADNTSGGMYGYRMSKAAANMAGVNLAHDLRPRGIAVFLLHPGYVRTGMTGGQGFCDADEAARGIIDRMDTLTLEETGTFWHANGEALLW
jgi:NAD(P)-dependent dehydrogenase (short-subunit alcohol dehydrogenase family)